MNKQVPSFVIISLLTLALSGCGKPEAPLAPTPNNVLAPVTDIPVLGDWNGNGKLKTGIFRNGLWILDYNGDGVMNITNPGPDRVFQYTATPGDVPVVGDWNGDGTTKTGVYRNGQWILDYNGDGKIDYQNLGADKVFQYSGSPGDIPVVGDWNGDHRTKTGVFRSGTWILDFDGNGVVKYGNLGPDRVFQFGQPK